PASKPSPRAAALRRRLGLCLLLLFGLLVGALVPWLWAVDARVREEFGALKWQVPTRVLARPLLLETGLPMNAAALERELLAARYREDGEARLPGRYARDGERFTIHSRDF